MMRMGKGARAERLKVQVGRDFFFSSSGVVGPTCLGGPRLNQPVTDVKRVSPALKSSFDSPLVSPPPTTNQPPILSVHQTTLFHQIKSCPLLPATEVDRRRTTVSQRPNQHCVANRPPRSRNKVDRVAVAFTPVASQCAVSIDRIETRACLLRVSLGSFPGE